MGYIWQDGELVTAEKLNNYGSGMEQIKADVEEAKQSAKASEQAAGQHKKDVEAIKLDITALEGSTRQASESAKTSAGAAETAKQEAETHKNSALAIVTDFVTTIANRIRDYLIEHPPITHSWSGTKLTINSLGGGSDTVDLKGEKGNTGDNGISPTIEATKSGKTTTVTVNDVTGIKTFTIQDGIDGQGSGDMRMAVYDKTGKQQDVYSYTDGKVSDAVIPINTALEGKVDKEPGKGLSPSEYTLDEKNKVTNLPANTNSELAKKVNAQTGYGLSQRDFTTALEQKLNGIANGATKNVIINQTISLGTTWTDEGIYKVQTVNTSNILSTDSPILDIIASTTDFEAEMAEWGKVFKAVANNNSIKFYAKETTTKALSISLKVVR